MEDKNEYGLWMPVKEEEFQEQDMWDVLDGYENDQSATGINQASNPSFPAQRYQLSNPRVIPRTTTSDFGTRQHSAPVSVPDWSRIHTIKPKKAAKTHDDDDDDGDDYDDGGGGVGGESVSPEEYFMGRIRSSPSLSVMEGSGRTLKGKDLSEVRNAVLKKTGFLE